MLVSILLSFLWIGITMGQTQIDCLHHYCGCPPFLPDNPLRSIHFTKYPYAEHYAILGKAKELHCCFGGNFTNILWFKDDQPYPWPMISKGSLPVLYAKNQSLILLDVTPTDEGQYKCVGTDGKQTVEHVSRLRSFSLPAFRHPPIWKDEPQDVIATEGEQVILNCAATVGPQYDTFRLQPVKAVWQNQQGQPIQGNDVKILRNQVDDEMVESVKIEFSDIKTDRSGKYTCSISNNYGSLRKTINLKIGSISQSTTSSGKDEEVRTKMVQLLEKQFKIWRDFSQLSKKFPESILKVQDDLIRKIQVGN